MFKKVTNTRTAAIAAKNDAFRRSLKGCVVTRGVTALEPLLQDIFVRVRAYSDFTMDNDPYQEHDFGSFDILGHTIFWKTSYIKVNPRWWILENHNAFTLRQSL